MRNNNTSVECWGSDFVLQLGDGGPGGGSSFRTYPAPVVYDSSGTPLTGVTSIAAGWDHTCAILQQSGQVVCWGNSDFGSLGNGSPSGASSPYPVLVENLLGVTMVSASGDHTCALNQYGVSCWGDNFSGQLGNGSTVLEMLVPSTVRFY